MKKLWLLLLLLIPICINADTVENIYLFYQDGCPHCEEEMEYLESISSDYSFNLIKYEVSNNEDNYNYLLKVLDKIGVGNKGVPFTIIGTDYYVGFNSTTSPNDFISSINKLSDSKDVIKMIDNNEDISNINFNDQKSSTKTISIFGHNFTFDAKTVSLPLISIVIGFVDGFNPCSMWVLLFLIGMLLNMKDKKKKWILGLTFIFTSGLMYFLIMGAWLKVAMSFMAVKAIKIIIALVALVAGCINLSNYFKSLKKNDGCSVVEESKRSKTFDKIRNVLSEKKFILSLLGIMGLAISVNLVELACSIGLPLVFTEVLAFNNLSTLSTVLYMILYVIFFLIDDIVIFVIAMVTLDIKGISSKYTKYSHLIGGIIMIIIGLLMLFKPDWLMFNF